MTSILLLFIFQDALIRKSIYPSLTCLRWLFYLSMTPALLRTKKTLAVLIRYLDPCSSCISAEISTPCYLNFNDAPCQPVVTTERNPDRRWIVATVPHSHMKIKCLHLGCFLQKKWKSDGNKAQDWFLSEKYELFTVTLTLLTS